VKRKLMFKVGEKASNKFHSQKFTEGSVSDNFNGFMGVDSKHAKRASAGRPSVKSARE
jgi:hypothetical protein